MFTIPWHRFLNEKSAVCIYVYIEICMFIYAIYCTYTHDTNSVSSLSVVDWLKGTFMEEVHLKIN